MSLVDKHSGSEYKVVQKPLNVMLTVSADTWLYQTLPRFLGMLHHSNPTARVHILLVLMDSRVREDEIKYLKTELGRFAVQVKVLRSAHTDKPDMLFFEKLRTVILDIFDLDEGLYVDTDVDMVESVEPLVITHTDKVLLWTPDAVPMEDCIQALHSNGYTEVSALMQCGFLYLRRYDYRTHFERLQAKFPVIKAGIPGTVYWNMLMHDLGSLAQELPAEYHRTFWDIPFCVSTVRAVHYSGRWKDLQPYMVYIREPPDTAHARIQPVPVFFPEFEITPYEWPPS